MTEAPPAKAFLLAAGLGTRLKPLTDKTPKCLLPVGGRPILDWWLKALETLGVREVLLNTHHLADEVRRFVASEKYSLRVRLFHEERLLGSAGTIAANRAFVEKEEDFWILYADTFVSADLRPLVALHRRGAAATLGLFRTPDPKSCGILELDAQGRVLSFEEKPARPKSDLAAAGVYVAGPKLLRELPQGAPSKTLDLGKDVLPRLSGDMRAMLLDGTVLDIGTPANYALAQNLGASRHG